jgi:tetratricopeptide (TPR) repeat protein
LLKTLTKQQVDKGFSAFLNKYMGDLESRLGQIEAAQGHYAAAEELYRSEKHNLGLANVLKSMGDLERESRNYPKSIGRYENALLLYESEQEPQGKGYTMGELCRAYALAGKTEEALLCIEKTMEFIKGMPKNIRPYVADCIKEALGPLGVSSNI